MTSLNVASIQFFKRKITQPPIRNCESTSHHYTITPLYYYTSSQPNSHNSLLHNYTTTPLYDYTSLPFTTHHSLLIAALGLIEFSIQWLWSIATNPSLELTGTTYYFTTILIHHNTITPVHPLRDSRDTESV